jgi:lysophospholipase L1-like esterase
MKLQNGQRLVTIGDSITDCDRARPIADGLFDPLGRGYVTQVNALLGATYPDRLIRITNVGTSGNTVRDLAGRWETDVLDLKPDWVTCMIGTNDVWRQFDSPLATEHHVLPDEYETTYARLIETTLPKLKGGMVLMTPFFAEPNPQDAMRRRMDEYGGIVKKLGERFKLAVVDTQAAFDVYLQNKHSCFVAWDRVHPNQVGHMILAKALLKAFDFDWNGPAAATA